LTNPLIAAEQLDLNDPLAAIKNKFELPPNTLYLDGNSLGPMLKSIKQASIDVIQEQWGKGLITSWNAHDWIDLPLTVGEKIAPLIGAAPGQVICTDSVSINLFKLIGCAMKLNPERHLLMTETNNFPTDIYIAESIQAFLGNDQCQLTYAKSGELIESLNQDIAVLLLTQVDFRSGRLHDIEQITNAAHKLGIIVIWDLAHSVGALPLELDAWNVDFAVGCGYKYLNGGPGAPAFIYAAKRHHSRIQQPLAGWMGHKAPFNFEVEYAADPGIRQFLCGTPPIISMHVLNTALDVFQDITMQQVRDKAMALLALFEASVKESNLLSELHLASPTAPAERGNQLAYRHPQAYAICQALIAEGVIADFRSPDVLRFGFSPLFLSFADIVKAVQTLEQLFEEKSYKKHELKHRQKVT